jgi:hypothetical protein
MNESGGRRYQRRRRHRHRYERGERKGSRGKDGGSTFAFGAVTITVGRTCPAMSAVSSRVHPPPLSFLPALDCDRMLVGHPLPLLLDHGTQEVDGAKPVRGEKQG